MKFSSLKQIELSVRISELIEVKDRTDSDLEQIELKTSEEFQSGFVKRVRKFEII